jgi:hypothetical protein
MLVVVAAVHRTYLVILHLQVDKVVEVMETLDLAPKGVPVLVTPEVVVVVPVEE